jgi:hypothetical protein
MNIRYAPTATGLKFHNDLKSLVRYVQGPVGSGKTTMCVLELFFAACRQQPDAQGVRRTRWVAIRSTRPELLTTVLETWKTWFGDISEISHGVPITARVDRSLPDGTKLDMEVWFLALESDQDVVKLRSLEVTGGYISEASQIPAKVLEMLIGRIPRFPKYDKGTGYGASWYGVIMESNPPPIKHWLYTMFEVDKPEGFVQYKQPPALLYDPIEDEYTANPEAENIENHKAGYDYYMNQVRAASKDYVNVYILAQYGMSFSGKPVYPQFSQSVHVNKQPMVPIPGMPVIVGMDFGLQSACVFTQMSPTGSLLVLDEIPQQDCTLEEFVSGHLIPKRAQRFYNTPLTIVGDPAGASRSALNIKTSFDILRSAGLSARPARTNDVIQRVQSVGYFLDRRGGFFIDPSCADSIEALSGGYRYAKRRSGDIKTEYHALPDKNSASHLMDALQYACMHHRTGALTPRTIKAKTPAKAFKYV